MAIAGFSLPAMLLLLANQFHPKLALALGLVGSLVALGLARSPSSATLSIRTACWNALCASLIAGWTVWNGLNAGEDVYATRDPANYVLAARWLMSHSSLQITTHPEVFGAVAGGSVETPGFQSSGTSAVHAQGAHLLPALSAIAGSVFGEHAIFVTNSVLTGMALLTIYGLAGRLVTPTWALVATMTVALSIPFIYVSRDSFSESLAAIFVLGAMSYMQRALSSGRGRDYALVGWLSASAALARVSGFATFVPFAAVAALYVLTSPAHSVRVRTRLASTLFISGLFILALAWLDLAVLSSDYYSHNRGSIALAGCVILVCICATFVSSRLARLSLVRLRLQMYAASLPVRRCTTVLILGSALLLASRPLWMASRTGSTNSNLENMQRAWGVVVDGRRSYVEDSLSWIATYFGWPLVCLAILGYAMLARQALRRPSLFLTAVLIVGLGFSLFYLIRPEIAPDQPWASRRYIPVVIPIGAIAAAHCAATVVRCIRSRLRRQELVWLSASLGVILASTCALPLVGAAWVMRGVSDERGQFVQVNRLCFALGAHAAVVELDKAVSDGYGQTLRSFCGAVTLSVPQVTQDALARMAVSSSSYGYALYAITQDPGLFASLEGSRPTPFSSLTTEGWPNAINAMPNRLAFRSVTVFLGRVQMDGHIYAVSP